MYLLNLLSKSGQKIQNTDIKHQKQKRSTFQNLNFFLGREEGQNIHILLKYKHDDIWGTYF